MARWTPRARCTTPLRQAGIRSHLDERSETLSYKIRDAETHKVPYMAVVGQREAEAKSVACAAEAQGTSKSSCRLVSLWRSSNRKYTRGVLKPLI